MVSYKILLALIVTLAVPAFIQTSDVHAMQVAIDNLPTEFGSFEVPVALIRYPNRLLHTVT